MDLGFFKRITSEMRDAGVSEIGVFFIGESFMAPDLLIDAVLYLKRVIEMPYVFLTSNGSVASRHCRNSSLICAMSSTGRLIRTRWRMI